MDIWDIVVLSCFLISLALTVVVIPKILLISFKKRLFDIPDERKVHKGVVPRLGGVSFFPAILFSMSFVIAIFGRFLGVDSGITAQKSSEIALILCGMILLYLIGIADDLIGARYRSKFIIQIICGTLITMSGLWINDLYGIFGIHELPAYLGIPFSIFVIVFITNAINLIDGIDGLASGLSSVALAVFGAIFLHQGEKVYAMLSFSTLGVLLPFFYFNVFGKVEHGRKIFMGDTGSLTIGMILSVLAIRLSMNNPEAKYQLDGAIVIALSLLIVPVFDVVRVVLHRWREGKHLFKPDKNHIHHKFLALGYTPRRAMVTILCISALFAATNIIILPYVNCTVVLLLDIFVWYVMHLLMSHRIKKIKQAQEQMELGQETVNN